jgi:hypothetical protein
MQLKMAWLEGTRNRLQVFVEQGGNLESEEANLLNSAFFDAFRDLAMEFDSRAGKPLRSLSKGLASKTTGAPGPKVI